MGTALTYAHPAPPSVRAGTLSGVVTPPSGKSAEGIRAVALVAHNYTLHASAPVAADGTYQLSHLDKARNYHVVVEDYDGGTRYNWLIRANVTPG